MNQNARTVHLATLAHAGLLWDAYLEPESETSREVIRACIRFSSPEAEQLYRTAAIIIEASWDDAVRRAKGLEDRQLAGLLRSVLPEEADAPAPSEKAATPEAESGAQPPAETTPPNPGSTDAPGGVREA